MSTTPVPPGGAPDPFITDAHITDQLAAMIQRQLSDQAQRFTAALVHALIAEQVSEETAARVLNRIATGVPDPDSMSKPAGRRVTERLEDVRRELSRRRI